MPLDTLLLWLLLFLCRLGLIDVMKCCTAPSCSDPTYMYGKWSALFECMYLITFRPLTTPGVREKGTGAIVQSAVLTAQSSVATETTVISVQTNLSPHLIKDVLTSNCCQC